MARKSLTLLELVIVVIIVGIIATFAIPGYLGVRQRAEGRQASTQLRLIHTAEKIEFLEEDLYTACSFPLPAAPAPNNCNVALDLDLPDDTWAYVVVCLGGCANDFTAMAVNNAGTCTYSITRDTAMAWTPGCVYHP